MTDDPTDGGTTNGPTACGSGTAAADRDSDAEVRLVDGGEASAPISAMRLTSVTVHEPNLSLFEAVVEDGMGGAPAEVTADRVSGWFLVRVRQGLRPRAEGARGAKLLTMRPRMEDLFWTTAPFSSRPECQAMAGGFLPDPETCFRLLLDGCARMCRERSPGRSDATTTAFCACWRTRRRGGFFARTPMDTVQRPWSPARPCSPRPGSTSSALGRTRRTGTDS